MSETATNNSATYPFQKFETLAVGVEEDGSVELADKDCGWKYSVHLRSVTEAIAELEEIIKFLRGLPQ